MKGLMGLLAKTGFVTPVSDGADQTSASIQSHDPVDEGAAFAFPTAPVAPVEQQIALSLSDVYAAAGVPESAYPAEKLLRVLDGLKAMDQGTQKAAIAAMDAADDGWTIEDPIQDAELKVQALAAHANGLRAGIEQAEAQTMDQIAAVKQDEEAMVADIRKQITDLEGLMTRAIASSVQAQADLANGLKTKRESANALIEQLLVTSTAFKLLVHQFRQAPIAQASAEQGASQTSAGA